ncbi:hypothetical protein AVEN_24833-1 [Araneus ventricosus]|uniref:Uncharacterized protein n=1 Tax=Araneus ventricosus TaxID=182803 RepID=A0A4Y2BTS2_ARAVE|nr:hypothetical protein AVEN_24833-1 [Araneus ventricosus]
MVDICVVSAVHVATGDFVQGKEKCGPFLQKSSKKATYSHILELSQAFNTLLYNRALDSWIWLDMLDQVRLEPLHMIEKRKGKKNLKERK